MTDLLRRLRAVVLLPVLLLAVPAVPAQEEEPPGDAAEEEAEKELFRSFAVPENRTANDLYHDALRLLAERRFAAALPMLQELIDRYDNKVVRVPEPDRAESLYHGLGREVGNLVRDLPAEGKKQYGDLYDGMARRRLERALARRDARALRRVVRRFRYTEAGAKAVEALGDLSLERGDARGAAHFYRELATSHDARERRRLDPMKLVYALARAGRREDAERLARRVEERGGRDAAAGSPIEAARRWSPPFMRFDREYWPFFGGDATHTRLMPALREVSRIEWRESVSVLLDVDLTDAEEIEAPITPIVGRGKIYIHNGIKVWAYNLNDGLPVWRFRGEKREQRSADHPDTGAVYAGALADDVYVVNLEVPQETPEHYYHAIPIQRKIPIRKLYAFDADAGTIRWSHAPGRFDASAPIDERAFLSKVGVPSPVVVRDGVAYCGASYFEGKIYAYLMAVDTRTGRLLWRTLVCTGQQVLNMFGRPLRESILGVPAVSGDTVYFTTNLGVVAAVDAHLGTIRWVASYPQRTTYRTGPLAEVGPRHGWRLSPTIVHQGVVVTAPTDADDLFGFDAATGRIRWRQTRDRSDQIEFTHLLGARDDAVYVSGNGIAAFGVKNGRPLWSPRRFPHGERISWRGGVTREAVLVPTIEHLRVYDPATGRLLVDPPTPWDARVDHAGNVLAVSEDLLVTMSRLIRARTAYLNVFYDRERRLARLKRRVQLQPRDPAPRLDLAHTMAQCGLTAEAGRAFERAAEQAGKLPGERGRKLQAEAARGRFEMFARLGRRALDDDRFDTARRHFAEARVVSKGRPFHLDAFLLEELLARREGDLDRLSAFYKGLHDAFGDRTHVFPDWGEIPVGLYARLRAAEIHRALDRPKPAVEAMQAIIRDYGNVYLPATRAHARDYAIEVIRGTLARHGRKVYARHDAAARALWERGVKSSDVKPLREVIRRYPNAAVVGRCLLADADASRRDGDTPGAMRMLRRLFRHESGPDATGPLDPADAARALATLVEGYLELGAPASARELADRLVAEYADVKFRTDRGETHGRAWFTRFVKAAPRRARRPRPRDVGTPTKAWTHAFQNGCRMEVLEQTTPAAERRLLLASSVNVETGEATLHAFRTTAPPRALWQAVLPETPSRPVTSPASVKDGRVVVALERHVLALDATTGTMRWRRQYDGREVCGVAVREGLALVLAGRTERDVRGPARRRRPVLEAIDLVTGATAWRLEFGGEYPLPPIALKRHAIVTVRKNPSVVSAVDLLRGAVTGRRELADRFVTVDPAPLDVGGLLLSPDSRAHLMLTDPAKLQAQWTGGRDRMTVERLVPGPAGALVVGTVVGKRSRHGGVVRAESQHVVHFDPARPGFDWRLVLGKDETLDPTWIVAGAAHWFLPVRDANGRVKLTALDSDGKTVWVHERLFERNVFQTPIYRVPGGVLALGFDPTARDSRTRPSVRLRLLGLERGEMRWSESRHEPTPPRGTGVWPAPTGFFVAWSDRLEYYDMTGSRDRG